MPEEKKIKLPYLNSKLTVEERINDLVSRMTVEEKISQLKSQLIMPDEIVERKLEVGHLRGPATFANFIQKRSVPASECAHLLNEEQRKAIEHSRLKIPVLINCESLHGAQWGDATCFPQSIALASTWNTELMYNVAKAIAVELRAVGVRQVFAPVVNIARDSRWGRTQETYGEDPYLSSKMGLWYVKALEEENIIATPKHFAANIGDGGRDSNAVHFSERLLREIYFPAFKACITEGGARSVMSAYNSLDGIPCSCNKWLLTEILREEWGFEGFVCSDYGSVHGIYDAHNVAQCYEEASKQSLEAGLDLELPNGGGELGGLVNRGELPVELIEKSVRRILKAKLELGLFEEPYVEPEEADRIVRCQEHKNLALQAARESMILLKNNSGSLPLDRKTVKKIGLFGPTKDTLNLGDYSGPFGGWQGDGITPLEGLRQIVPEIEILVHQYGEDPAEMAKKCDVSLFFCAIYETEGCDRSSLDLPSDDIFHDSISDKINKTHAIIVDEWQRDLRMGNQEETILKIAATGVKTIVILINGSAVTMGKWINSVDAVLEAWYAGEQGGIAIAETLFGLYNPAGRLPITFPKSVGQLPLYYNYKPSGRKYDYINDNGEPLYSFGFGLSYTEFEYLKIETWGETFNIGDDIEVSVTIKNIGSRSGDEVVQLYVRDEISTVARPLKELKGFKRINLARKEIGVVKFVLTEDDLAIWDKDFNFRVEPGWLKIMIGSSSSDIRLEKRILIEGNIE